MKLITITAAALILAGAAIGASKFSDNAALAKQASAVAASKLALADIGVRMRDSATLMVVASAATRTAEVPRLQQVAREAQALVVPACLGEVRAGLADKSKLLAENWVLFVSGSILLDSARNSTYPAVAFNRDLPAALAKACLT